MLKVLPQGHEFGLTLGSVSSEVRVTRFRLEEGLSSIPRAEIELICAAPDVSFDEVMDQDAQLTIRDRDGVERVFAGMVSGFAQGDTGFHWTAYRAVIEAPLHRLQYRSDSRIFQQLSVEDIIAQVLNDAGVSQHRFSLTETRPVREYCVQYRESDYDFFARLCAEEGLVFYHSYDGGVPMLEISDKIGVAEVAPGLSGAVTYKSAGGGLDPDLTSFIQRFEYQENLRAGNLAQRDYWFKKPLYFWDKEAQVNTAPLQGKTGTAGSDLNLYDGYSRGHHEADDKTAARYATYRLEAHRADSAVGKGRSTVAPLCPGFAFTMEGFAQAKLDQQYLVTQLIHEGSQPQALDQDAPEESSEYHNRFEVIPAGIDWRADHYFHGDAPRKPRVDGPQLARVVGPAGEEIFCDDYGRVKLQFPWDRHGQGDENSSCWVRVSQLWAGTKYGGMAIPRIGQEVIVEFLDGDIDQPIITGRTYNAHNLPPYDLPVNKTRTTIKSDSHKADGFNELRFEDEGGKEEVFINAQKDETINVNNDKNQTVGHDETHSIGNDHTHSVGNDQTMSVGHDRMRSVGNDETWSVGNDQAGSVGNDQTLNVGNDVYKTVGQNAQESYGKDQVVAVGNIQKVDIYADQVTTIGRDRKEEVSGAYELNVVGSITNNTTTHTLMAGSKFTIKGPGGMIELDAGGVTITGAKIDLKGAVSMGGGGSVQVPTLAAAANEGLPLCEECAKKEDA